MYLPALRLRICSARWEAVLCGFSPLVMDAAVSAPVCAVLIIPQAPPQPGLRGWEGEAGFLFAFSLCAIPTAISGCC